MTTVIPKILLLDDAFRDTARILYSQIIKKGEELDRWDLNNLVHLLQLLWGHPMQVVNFQAAIITKDPYSECTIVSMPKDQSGIGNFRISPVKVACCLFRWPKLTEIRRISSTSWCKAKLNSGTNKVCLNPYHYQAKLAHYEFQYVSNITHDIQFNENHQIIFSKNGVRKVKYLKNKENNILLAALNNMPRELVESVQVDFNITTNMNQNYFPNIQTENEVQNCQNVVVYDPISSNANENILDSSFSRSQESMQNCQYSVDQTSHDQSNDANSNNVNFETTNNIPDISQFLDSNLIQNMSHPASIMEYSMTELYQ